jgi:hypothetical protein
VELQQPNVDPWSISMKLICIESPYTGDIARNVRYLAWCIKHVYDYGHAAYAGHGLGPCAYPEDERGRKHGLDSDLAFRQACDETWFFVDYGMTYGMRQREAVEGLPPYREVRLPPDDFAACDRGEWPPGSTLRWYPPDAVVCKTCDTCGEVPEKFMESPWPEIPLFCRWMGAFVARRHGCLYHHAREVTTP